MPFKSKRRREGRRHANRLTTYPSRRKRSVKNAELEEVATPVVAESGLDLLATAAVSLQLVLQF